MTSSCIAELTAASSNSDLLHSLNILRDVARHQLRDSERIQRILEHEENPPNEQSEARAY